MNLDLLWLGSYDECYSEQTVADLFLHPTIYTPPVKPHYCDVFVNLPLPGGAAGVTKPHCCILEAYRLGVSLINTYPYFRYRFPSHIYPFPLQICSPLNITVLQLYV
jgi:hypothetical protein